MPSDYTNRNRLEKQAAGENNNTWGDRLNDNVIEMIDESTDGIADFTLSGTMTLTVNDAASDQARCRVIHIKGGTGGTITIPSVEKNYLVRNVSSGNVIFTTGAGTSATVVSGAVKWIFCTGENAVYQTLGPDFGALGVATTGTGTFGSLTCSGAATFAGFTQVNSALRTTGLTIPNSGAGVEIQYNSGGNVGYVICVDRTGGLATHKEMLVQANPLKLYADAMECIRITTTGLQSALSLPTTASPANLFIDTSLSPQPFKRSTSSIAFKKDIEPVDPAFSVALLELQPIWYRSKCEGDDPSHSFWGFAAEDAALVDPRMVSLGYFEEDHETVELLPAEGAKGKPAGPSRTERRIKAGAELKPVGFNYERLGVHHHVLLQQLWKDRERAAALEARIAALEAA